MKDSTSDKLRHPALTSHVSMSAGFQVYMCLRKMKLKIHDSTHVELIRMTVTESDDKTDGKHGLYIQNRALKVTKIPEYMVTYN